MGVLNEVKISTTGEPSSVLSGDKAILGKLLEDAVVRALNCGPHNEHMWPQFVSVALEIRRLLGEEDVPLPLKLEGTDE